MQFNVKKCKVIHVGRRTDCYEYYMGGKKLEEETLEKDLGVWISADMKCSQQCRYAVNKANKVLGMIKRTITFKDLKIMLNLYEYKTLVRPHVEYCVSAWNPYYKKDKELLEKVQRRFTKMIKGMKDKSYEERLQRLNLWSLEERRNRQDLIEVFKICKGLSRIRSEELFNFDNRDKGTRGHSQRVIKRWKQLDQEAVDATSSNAFKSELDKLRHTRMGFFMD